MAIKKYTKEEILTAMNGYEYQHMLASNSSNPGRVWVYVKIFIDSSFNTITYVVEINNKYYSFQDMEKAVDFWMNGGK